MKTFLTILSMIGLFLFVSCNQNTNANRLLENEKTREEIFNTIGNNHDYMMDFMESVQTNDHAMNMMQGHPMMMRHMMNTQMQNMMNNRDMMDSVMMNMLNDENTMSRMMQMMHDNHMISQDCMQSTMNMMHSGSMKNSK
ncbi:hypothetical protein V8G61_06690 [Gaetbulibacter sp. M240]|uniref:hypothetical protein n=1 Tax=Gaetbulibacter sp. M240 TaxID=3126511 RepID=UPI00374E747A